MSDEVVVAQIRAAVNDATRCYLAERRARVAPFTRRHFSFRGALRINRWALGKDLLRTPTNVLWSIPYLLARGGAALSRKLRLDTFAQQLDRLPPGFKTDVEREIEWLIYSELLELPFNREGRCCARDALLETILAHPTISQLLIPELIRLDDLAHHQNFRQRLEKYLSTYASSRTAVADLSGSLLGLAAGIATFQQFTPGAVAIGGATATVLANHLAIANFMLGPTLGSMYYGLFPATVSAGLLVTTTGGLIVALGVLTAGAGVIADPLQQAMGLHERKLLKLLDALEDELTCQGNGYRLHDAYVARIFDLWDLLQVVTRTLS
ncbi:MAG: hypothetical protein IPL59_06305 [Candidatus Competibacteraceae bacterium]|nr:DUF6635 family protein [Candidatus Contendobacter odensis]MBK8534749.1 hypothetical protein [Candidatus Competibacteraceae bacterium]MBK8753600.1 hypothetical protein [Candidatus Competibacteraceae bacterium]